MTSLPRARGFILDMDGTLVDTHLAHQRAWDRITREHGHVYTPDEISRHFGKTTPAIAAELFHVTDPGFIASVSATKASYFIEEAVGTVAFEGVHDVLSRIKDAGRTTCVASSNVRRAIDAILASTGLAPLVDDVVALDDITRGKPDPEMILLAASRLGLQTTECIVVGDTVYDIQAGNAAGCFSVGVLTGTTSEDALVAAGAGLVLGSIAGMSELLEASTP